MGAWQDRGFKAFVTFLLVFTIFDVVLTFWHTDQITIMLPVEFTPQATIIDSLSDPPAECIVTVPGGFQHPGVVMDLKGRAVPLVVSVEGCDGFFIH